MTDADLRRRFELDLAAECGMVEGQGEVCYEPEVRELAQIGLALLDRVAAQREALRDLLDYIPETGATIRAGYGEAARRARRVLDAEGVSEPGRRPPWSEVGAPGSLTSPVDTAPRGYVIAPHPRSLCFGESATSPVDTARTWQVVRCTRCGHVWDEEDPTAMVCACIDRFGERTVEIITAGATNQPATGPAAREEPT